MKSKTIKSKKVIKSNYVLIYYENEIPKWKVKSNNPEYIMSKMRGK